MITDIDAGLLEKIAGLADSLMSRLATLEADTEAAGGYTDLLAQAKYYHDTVFADMQALREVADQLELAVPAKYWSLPTYGELLYSIL